MGIATQQEALGAATGRGVRVGLILTAVFAFTYLTLRGLDQVHLFGDEFHSVRNLGRSYGELAGLYDAYGSGILLPLGQKFASDLLGPGLLSYRIPSWLGGLGALLLSYPTARRLVGPAPAAATTLALALSPFFCFYSRYGRSYSMAACFALLFALCMLRLGSGRLSRTGRGVWIGAAVLAGALLPYAHLFAVSSLVAIALGGVIGLAPRVSLVRERPPSRVPVLLAIGIAPVLGALFYLPALTSLGEFFERKAFAGAGGEFGVGDVLRLLYGNRLFGWAALGLVPAALFLLGRRDPRRAFFLGCAALGPVVALLVSRPPGLPYAYARYLLPALPFQWMALAWLFAFGVRKLARKRPSESAISLASAALVFLLFLQSPLVSISAATGPFANSNLALTPLPAFDTPWPGRSKFYDVMESTEEDVTLIEAPELWNRSGLLHRNAWLQHQKNIVVGHVWQQDPQRVPAGGPYVNLNEADWRGKLEADYLVFHRTIYKELTNYWDFVWNKCWPEIENPANQAFMDAHSQYGFVKERLEPLWEAEKKLRAQLGKPTYEDPLVCVWDLSAR